LPQVSSSN